MRVEHMLSVSGALSAGQDARRYGIGSVSPPGFELELEQSEGASKLLRCCRRAGKAPAQAVARAGCGLGATGVVSEAKAVSNTSSIKSASAWVMHMGGAKRMMLPERPPLPSSKPISRAASST